MDDLAQKVQSLFMDVPPLYWVELQKYHNGMGDGNDVDEILEQEYNAAKFPLDESFLIAPTPAVAVRLLGALTWRRAYIIDLVSEFGSKIDAEFEGDVACDFMANWEPLWTQAFLNVSANQLDIVDEVFALKYDDYWGERDLVTAHNGKKLGSHKFVKFATVWRKRSWALRQFL